MNRRCTIVLVFAMASASSAAAQASGGLRQPSRTAYKCESAGKVTYSDEPCAGASVVDCRADQGLNKSSGRERTGADVARERGGKASLKHCSRRRA
jgi:hypothetical protein